jgi:hypothetical protein
MITTKMMTFVEILSVTAVIQLAQHILYLRAGTEDKARSSCIRTGCFASQNPTGDFIF